MTLYDVFESAMARQLSGAVRDAKRAALTKKLSEAVSNKGAKAHAMAELVLRKLAEVLHIEVSTIIGAVWSQSEFLQNYLDRESLGPSEAIDVAVGEHDVSSNHQPSMDIILNGVSLGTVVVDIDVGLTFEGMVLNIESWKLAGINPASCSIFGTISCLGITLVEKDAEPVELPETLRFKRAMPIGPAGDAKQSPTDD